MQDLPFFLDWLKVYQDHDFELPLIADCAHIVVDTATGERMTTRQPPITHKGSFSTSIQITISGNRVTVSGNPSRFDRLENLFGFTSFEDCIGVYNRVLLSLGLPPFTKCRKVWYSQPDEKGRFDAVTDGAVFTEMHITSNVAVGQGNERDYIKGFSTLRYRNSLPHLFPNGRACDWRSAKGKASLVYPSVYDKAHELRLHALPKLRAGRAFEYQDHHGTTHAVPDQDHYQDLLRVIEFCESRGVVRFEQKLKSAFLRRENLRHYGLFCPSVLSDLHREFLALDDRLQVTAMTLETIADKLLRLGVCESTLAANTSALYAMQWMSGKTFDLSKSQVKTHRARLRKIGIDIADTCDITRHSPVMVRKAVEIEVTPLAMPDWYRRPVVQPLRLVA